MLDQRGHVVFVWSRLRRASAKCNLRPLFKSKPSQLSIIDLHHTIHIEALVGGFESSTISNS